MFGSQIVDVAIGIVMAFLVLSLICSSLKEGLESFFKFRAKDLRTGLIEIFNDVGTLRDFYSHPLIYALFEGNYKAGSWRNLPSYIPSRTFAHTLLDLYNNNQQNEKLRRIMEPFLRASGIDGRGIVEHIEHWFNASMDRVSGRYKRRTQYTIAFFAVLIAFGFNIDSIAIARYLNVTPQGRAALIEQVKELTAADSAIDKPIQEAKLKNLAYSIKVIDIPIGWNEKADNLDNTVTWRRNPHTLSEWLLKFAGLMATALAVSLGAPFWFDVLNRFMVIRSTVKPEEKSRDEPSKA